MNPNRVLKRVTKRLTEETYTIRLAEDDKNLHIGGPGRCGYRPTG